MSEEKIERALFPREVDSRGTMSLVDTQFAMPFAAVLESLRIELVQVRPLPTGKYSSADLWMVVKLGDAVVIRKKILETGMPVLDRTVAHERDI